MDELLLSRLQLKLDSFPNVMSHRVRQQKLDCVGEAADRVAIQERQLTGR
jgi:hypothetical protein